MSVFAHALLYLAHLLYSFSLAVWSVHGRWFKHPPSPVNAPRSKTPKHLGIILVCGDEDAAKPAVRDAFVKSTERAAAWCEAAGIKQLTIYDRNGASAWI